MLFDDPASTDAEPQSEPHYKGHRDRLRARFLKSGIDALQDYEILELILFAAIPRRDVKPLAKSLLNQFGSFRAVCHASPAALQDFGLSENTATALKIIQASALHLLRTELIAMPVLNSWQKLLDYLQADMGHENREHFRLLFLNKKNELIADEIQQSGTVDHTPAYPREIMKRALELNATALILAHNHPSGDATPSNADIQMTENIMDAARPFGIVVHDHIIVSRNGVKSMKSLGLI